MKYKIVLILSACILFYQCTGQFLSTEDSDANFEQEEIESIQKRASTDLQHSLTKSDVIWMTGNLIIRTLSHNDGTDSMAYLLRSKTENGNELVELKITASLLGRIIPGTQVTARGSVDYDTDDQKILIVSEIFPSALAHESITYQLSINDVSQDPYSAVSTSYSSSTSALNSENMNLEGTAAVANLPDANYGVANSADTAGTISAAISSGSPSTLWKQIRTVTNMSVLVMVAQVCEYPAAVTSPSFIEQVMFDGPGSFASTLEGYFSECSQGKAYLNRNNSRVVGNVILPCSYNGTTITYNTDSCSYSNNDAWHEYAQYYVQTVMGIDITPYQHRVLLLPFLFTTWTGCGWAGQGTLGPDQVSATGEYLSSKVWLSGEYWNTPMTYFHELGHTNYLHHSIQAGCQYCDLSCPMGGCCSIRCFNAPHNWQLGWGGPIATLRSQNFRSGSWITFNLPAQNTAFDNMIMVQPDWNPFYNNGTATYTWYISYRVNSGKYDQQIPGEYTFVTNIYWWDGQYQLMPIMTNWMAGVYDGQIFTNMTDMFSVRQVSGGSLGAVVQLCRMSQVQERSCDDGLDNDCNGLIDSEDPACIAVAAGKPVPKVLVQIEGSGAKPPPPDPIRPPQPPSLPALPGYPQGSYLEGINVASPPNLPPPHPSPKSKHPPPHPKPIHHSEKKGAQKSHSPKKKSPQPYHKTPTKKKKSPPPHKKKLPPHHPPPHTAHPPPLSSASRKALEASLQVQEHVALSAGNVLNVNPLLAADDSILNIGNVAQQEVWDFMSAAPGMNGGVAGATGHHRSSEDSHHKGEDDAVPYDGLDSEEQQDLGEGELHHEVNLYEHEEGMMAVEAEQAVDTLVSILPSEIGGAEALLQRLREKQRTGRPSAIYSQRPLVKWWQIEAKERGAHWLAEEPISFTEDEVDSQADL
ncbi:hypothetical protein CEUSTIGMA_g3565.t1 [Chlamydomonas eustigma]|uniref:Peptidase M11 gametolysin domain-containing protein n=1 Tax=Chlamydomonas eustigma TaxID=1157962 RepID=A0A250WZT1_9CHLO|nr:hypothetical protein CEUSTIGMA_g3565.t1 [Chlamydomonas eustigma]|eukprot:GAX76122.1 hypothetical protein CEUSTIGMA_g3565.t1 [Chlamydomonas eustigma]